MESAFGVEHGGEEIAKLGMPSALLKPAQKIGSLLGRGTSKAGSQMKPLTANTKLGTKSIGVPKRGPTPGTTPSAGARQAAGGAKQATGGALRRAGSWMQANPGATGAAAIGGVAAGGAAYGAGRRSRRY